VGDKTIIRARVVLHVRTDNVRENIGHGVTPMATRHEISSEYVSPDIVRLRTTVVSKSFLCFMDPVIV
jgi:hypothetical protein